VCTLARYLEEEGVPAVAIALIREHAEKIRPPRALFVPFELGRPLGVPDDPAFQHRVLCAALALFEADNGPVLADYPEDASASSAGDAAWVCPIPLAPPPAQPDSSGFGEALSAEMRALAPFYLESVRRRGRTTVGLCGRAPETAAEILLAALVDPQAAAAMAPGLTTTQAIKLAAEDVRAWYQEAGLAKPGDRPTSLRLNDWFFGETTAGRVVLELRNRCKASDDPAIKALGTLLLVPRSQVHRLR